MLPCRVKKMEVEKAWLRRWTRVDSPAVAESGRPMRDMAAHDLHMYPSKNTVHTGSQCSPKQAERSQVGSCIRTATNGGTSSDNLLHNYSIKYAIVHDSIDHNIAPVTLHRLKLERASTRKLRLKVLAPTTSVSLSLSAHTTGTQFLPHLTSAH